MPLKTDGHGGWLPRGARGLLGGLPWKGLRRVCKQGLEGLKGLRGLRAGKRQPWMPLKTDGRGAWLPRGARGLLGGLPWKGLRRVWRVWTVWKVWGVWERANSLECPQKQMAVVPGCQEVQGACLQGCLGKACGGFGGFKGLKGLGGLRAGKRQPWIALETDGRGGWLPRGARGLLGGCLGKACGGFGAFWGFWGFGGFEAGQTAAFNALKNRWPWCLAAKRCKGLAWRVALERLADGLEGLDGLKGLRGLRAGKQPWMPLKTDGRGAWLPRGARGLLGGLPWKGLRRVWRVWRVLRVLRVWGVWGRANGSLECP